MLKAVFVFGLVVAVGVFSHAQVDLETADDFFGNGKNPVVEDDLDRAARTGELSKSREQLKIEDVTVGSEIQTTKPDIMSKGEAAAMDRKVMAENKRRNKAILHTISQNARSVRACLDKNKKVFHGSKITLKWMIDNKGQIVMADVTDSDIDSAEIHSCAREAAKTLNFSSAATPQYKKSIVQYTYRVQVKSGRMPASAHARKTLRSHPKTAPKPSR